MKGRSLDPHRPKVPDVVPLIRELYAQHSAGCCLHVVLDDGNVEERFMPHMLEYARAEGHPLCIRLAEMLAQMSVSQRRRASAAKWERREGGV